MRKIIIGIFLLTAFNSCKEVDKVENANKSLISNPNEFIGKHKAKAMILGSFHFSNQQLDGYKEQFSVDILTESKQREILEIVDKLAKFNPTKILIEVPRIEGDSIINTRYNQYLKNEFELRVNEQYQIGFRLAKKLEHDRIYPSDAKRGKWFGADMDWDNYDSDSYEKSLGQYKKTHRYDYEKIYRIEDSLKTVQSLIEHFRFMNNPKNTLKDQQSYLTNVVLTGAGDKYNGADNLARWYQRNLKIFSNIYDLTEFDKEERILLIYGVGHVYQLKQFLTDSPDFEYIEINEYLTE